MHWLLDSLEWQIQARLQTLNQAVASVTCQIQQMLNLLVIALVGLGHITTLTDRNFKLVGPSMARGIPFRMRRVCSV